MARWCPSELPIPLGRTSREGASWAWRVKARGHHQFWGTGREGWVHICDPGECVWPGMTVCSRPIGARKDEPPQYLRSYFLSLLLISAMRFTSSTIQHFLPSGQPAVFFLYFFPNAFGHHCCYWQLPVAALNATGCEGMFTFPQLHCL